MRVIEADIHGGRAARRDHVGGRIAAVNRGDRQRRCVEMRGSGVQWGRVQSGQQLHQSLHRVAGAVRISGMALHTDGRDMRRQRAASTDFHHIAQFVRAGRLAHKAMAHRFTVRRHPVEHRNGAISGHALFVTGDRQDHRTIGWGLPHEIHRSGHKGCDAGFHVGGTAPVDPAIHNRGPERVMRPGRQITDRHHIGVAVEPERLVRAPCAPAGKKVGHAISVDAGAGKPGLRQELFQQDQSPALAWGDRSATDQARGKVDGIGVGHGCLCI